uniref:hypothetical protein n=1 Tax=Rheinheimera sp. TaxID=1869214 RepID=UPI004047E0E6
MKRTTTVMIKVPSEWKGIPAGTVVKARTMGFGCVILEGEHRGTELGKAKYKVLRVLPEAEVSAA